MSVGLVISLVCGVLAPVSLVFACVFEFLAARLAKNPRCDRQRLTRRYTLSDVGNVAAWLFLLVAYLINRNAASTTFTNAMSYLLLGTLVADLVFLWLRRKRPRPEGKKKNIWEW